MIYRHFYNRLKVALIPMECLSAPLVIFDLMSAQFGASNGQIYYDLAHLNSKLGIDNGDHNERQPAYELMEQS